MGRAKRRADTPKDHAEQERSRIETDEDEVTSQSDDSFPTSDPPSWTPVRGPGGERSKPQKRHV